MMFMLPAVPIAPAMGSPICPATCAAAAVRADQVPGPDRVLVAAHPVPHARGDPVLVLFQDRYSVSKRILAPRAAALLHQDRFR